MDCPGVTVGWLLLSGADMVRDLTTSAPMHMISMTIPIIASIRYGCIPNGCRESLLSLLGTSGFPAIARPNIALIIVMFSLDITPEAEIDGAGMLEGTVNRIS